MMILVGGAKIMRCESAGLEVVAKQKGKGRVIMDVA